MSFINKKKPIPFLIFTIKVKTKNDIGFIVADLFMQI